MFDLLQSLLALGAALAANAARRTIGTVVGMLCAFGLMAVSVIFFTIAAYRALERAVGDIYAPAAIGCFFFVAFLIALLVVQKRKP
jgi:hypothetical protein